MQGLWGEARLDAMERIAPEPFDKAELTTEPKPGMSRALLKFSGGSR